MIARIKKFLHPYMALGSKYAEECLNGRRWGGNPLLIILDTSLTSTGFSYFNFVEPRVRKFQGTLSDELTLAKSAPLFQNKNWYCVSERCRGIVLSAIKNFSVNGDTLDEEFTRIKNWAIKADPLKRADQFSATKGLGVFTIQYLRGQVGLDVAIPDRVISDFLSKFLNKKFRNQIEVMQAVEEVASRMGISKLEFVWSIWIYADTKFNTNVTRL